MPAFWYFMSSFTFCSRLFIMVWRSQLTPAQIYNDQYQRKRLSLFYFAFYASSFTLLVFQNWFIHNTFALAVFNCGMWVPQIIKNYKERSRKGPSSTFCICLLAC